MKDDIYKIDVRINDESDLYNKFDQYNRTLNDDFVNYIETKVNKVPVYKKIIVDISSSEKVDVDNLRNVISEYIEDKINEKEKEIRFNNVKKIWLGIIGIIFILISISLKNFFDPLVVEILSIIGSFAIWEMADIMLLGNKKLKIEKLNLKRISNGDVFVIEDNKD